MNQHEHHLPKTMEYTSLSIDDMVSITEKLNAVLTTESNLLAKMQVKDLAPIQEEKQKLTHKLASFQRALAADDRVVREADANSRDRLLILAEDLSANIQENLRRMTIARAVNQRVMQTFMEALATTERPATYGAHGQTATATDVNISLNHNERA